MTYRPVGYAAGKNPHLPARQAEDGRFHAPGNIAAFSLKQETEGGRKEERKKERGEEKY